VRQHLPYRPNSSVLFQRLRDLPWPVFLDSGKPASEQGRYDILAADPFITLTTFGDLTRINNAGEQYESRDDPFSLLREQLQPVRDGDLAQLPFNGGAIGFFGYDLCRLIEDLNSARQEPEQLPEMAFGIYDWAVVVDHLARESWLVAGGRTEKTMRVWDQLVELMSKPPDIVEPGQFRVTAPVQSNLNREQYGLAFESIQRYILEGDCYQVNFSQRFQTHCEGDPWSAYLRLRETNPAPFAAYLDTPHGQVLSCSPERFLKLTGRMVETKPIKGTRPRSEDPVVDVKQRLELLNSEKDRAENLMIVDLLRNDLGKCCEPGSIHVPELFSIESFATVHHMVSTVRGTLQRGCDAVRLMRGAFPGGSITGAPKLRAMEIIDELEPDPRGVYCGSIAYIGFNGNMDSNIAIRTLEHRNGNVRFSAGGGIVADSVCEDEYTETFHKARAMLEVLGGFS
jgi:para-aminobenzoate synthetase component 1